MTTSGSADFAQSHDAVSERAADYFQRRRFWNWNEADQAELDAWLAESVLHEVAYLRLEGAVAHAGRLVAHRPVERSREMPDDGKKLRRKFVLPLLIAASIATILSLGFPLASYLMQVPDRSFSTDVGGRTLLKFVDGTEVELNTDTAIRFRMTKSERTVWLEKGEAWFHVSHDAANPFSVIVGRHRVTDLGTEFLVRRGADDMEVALLAGRAVLNTEGTPAAVLRPGDDAVAMPLSVSVTRRTVQQLADALAWRRGLLVFRNTRLADAVREFNRYNDTKLVIADPSIADLKFSAEIRNDNLEGFLQLAPILRLRADVRGNDVLLFREASAHTERAAP